MKKIKISDRLKRLVDHGSVELYHVDEKLTKKVMETIKRSTEEGQIFYYGEDNNVEIMSSKNKNNIMAKFIKELNKYFTKTPIKIKSKFKQIIGLLIDNFTLIKMSYSNKLNKIREERIRKETRKLNKKRIEAFHYAIKNDISLRLFKDAGPGVEIYNGGKHG